MGEWGRQCVCVESPQPASQLKAYPPAAHTIGLVRCIELRRRSGWAMDGGNGRHFSLSPLLRFSALDRTQCRDILCIFLSKPCIFPFTVGKREESRRGRGHFSSRTWRLPFGFLWGREAGGRPLLRALSIFLSFGIFSRVYFMHDFSLFFHAISLVFQCLISTKRLFSISLFGKLLLRLILSYPISIFQYF